MNDLGTLVLSGHDRSLLKANRYSAHFEFRGRSCRIRPLRPLGHTVMVPAFLLADIGTELVGRPFETVCKRLGSKHLTTTACCTKRMSRVSNLTERWRPYCTITLLNKSAILIYSYSHTHMSTIPRSAAHLVQYSSAGAFDIFALPDILEPQILIFSRTKSVSVSSILRVTLLYCIAVMLAKWDGKQPVMKRRYKASMNTELAEFASQPGLRLGISLCRQPTVSCNSCRPTGDWWVFKFAPFESWANTSSFQLELSIWLLLREWSLKQYPSTVHYASHHIMVRRVWYKLMSLSQI